MEEGGSQSIPQFAIVALDLKRKMRRRYNDIKNDRRAGVVNKIYAPSFRQVAVPDNPPFRKIKPSFPI